MRNEHNTKYKGIAMITIVESGGANIASVRFAFERLGLESEWTSDPDRIAKASHVLLPGVGAAAEAMRQMKARGLIECIKSLTCPVLGICLGMQLIFDHSEEGNVEMLGLIPGNISRFKETQECPVPHMGWNNIKLVVGDHPLLNDVADNSYVYFVHSYHASTSQHTIASCDYAGKTFSAIVAKDNVMGCQFHPERSSRAGSQIFMNFARL